MLEAVQQKFTGWFSNQENNNLPTSAVTQTASQAWNYAQTLLKGVGLVAVGGMAYTFFRSSSNTPRSTAEEDALTTANKNAEVNLIQRSKVDHSVSLDLQTQSNLPTQASQDKTNIAYRRKRDAVPVTGELQVNTYTISDQLTPAIASLTTGDFVITWASNNQVNSTSAADIFAQRFASDGTKLGSEFLVNTYTIDAQSNPAIASLSNGQFVVTWDSLNPSGYDIYAQRFASDGTKLGVEFLVNTYTTNYQINPAITGLANGEFVITWQSFSQVSVTSLYDIYAQRFASDGTKLGVEFLVNTYTTNYQINPAITGLANGEFVITWQSQNQVSGTSSHDVYAQRFASNGTKLGGEFLVNTYTTNVQADLAIAGLANGDFVIAWHSYNQVSGTSFYDVYAQRFAGDGTKLGVEFLVNTYTTDFQNFPAIVGLANGQFVITWFSNNQVSGTSSNDIYAQRFGIDGAALGVEFLVNTYTTDDQGFPAITGLSNDQFVITWQSNNQVSNTSAYDIYAEIFTISYQLPTLVVNTLSIDQGQTVVLGQNNLVANSGGGVDFNSLLFVSSNIQHGRFEQVNNPTNSISSFNQTQLVNHQIQFVHDDSYSTPSYEIAVNDSFSTTTPQAVVVYFDQKPQIITHHLTVNNGQDLRLSPDALLATDDNRNEVYFTVRNVLHSVFANTFASDAFSNPLLSFTQTQVNASQIRFVHDGSNIVPSYEIQASDGRLMTNFLSGQISFTPNVAPRLTNNQLTIVKGESHILDGTNLAVDDLDSDITKLAYQFDAIKNGVFELTTNPGQSIVSATQVQITAGQLLFKHDGSDNSPSYNVIATDGIDFSTSQAANVTFFLQSPLTQGNNSAVIGGAIGGTGAALLLAGAGIFGAYRYRQNKRLERERAQNPLANALYNALQINGVDDFQSDKGVAFVNAVNALENELSRANIDIKQMIPEEIEQLADKLKTAILAKVIYQKGFSGIDLNPLDIQDDAQAIVAIAKSIKATRNVDGDEVELDIMNKGSGFALLEQQLRHSGVNLDEVSADEINALTKQIVETMRAKRPSLVN